MNRLLSLVFATLTFSIIVESVDKTLLPNAHGPDVVEAVVNIIRESCLFADDRRFLRRLAYVESRDGSAPKTFRAGYYGGIWQVIWKCFVSFTLLMHSSDRTISCILFEVCPFVRVSVCFLVQWSYQAYIIS